MCFRMYLCECALGPYDAPVLRGSRPKPTYYCLQYAETPYVVLRRRNSSEGSPWYSDNQHNKAALPPTDYSPPSTSRAVPPSMSIDKSVT